MKIWLNSTPPPAKGWRWVKEKEEAASLVASKKVTVISLWGVWEVSVFYLTEGS